MTREEEVIRSLVRDVPHFPKKGIVFKDITPVLGDPRGMHAAVKALARNCRGLRPTKIVGIEARGFVFGAALAHHLGVGFVPLRKPGKLPWRTRRETYALEYGTDSIEIHVDAVGRRDRVVIVDDLLATGGTAGAALRLVRKLRARVVHVAFVVELEFLHGRTKLRGVPVSSIVKY